MFDFYLWTICLWKYYTPLSSLFPFSAKAIHVISFFRDTLNIVQSNSCFPLFCATIEVPSLLVFTYSHPAETVFAQYILKPVKARSPGTHFLPSADSWRRTKAIVSAGSNNEKRGAARRKGKQKQRLPEETNDPLSSVFFVTVPTYTDGPPFTISSQPNRGSLKPIRANLGTPRSMPVSENTQLER